METPTTALSASSAPWPLRSGAWTSNPAASNGVRKRSKVQPPQKAPCTMTMVVIRSPFFVKHGRSRLAFDHRGRSAARLHSIRRSRSRVGSKRLDHALIGLPFEGDDQLGRLGQISPTPCVEFWIAMCGKIELAILALKTEGEPYLLLALPTVYSLGGAMSGGEIIGDPVIGSPKKTYAASAGFFRELTARRSLQLLARINTALRKLPVVGSRRADAATKPHAPVGVKQDDADVWPIELEVLGH